MPIKQVDLKLIADRVARALLALTELCMRPQMKRLTSAIAIFFVIPVFGVLTAFGVSSDTATTNLVRQEITQPLALPAKDEHNIAAEEFRASERVQKGDSVAALLQRLSVNDPAAFNFLRTSKDAKSIFQLRPGRTVRQ